MCAAPVFDFATTTQRLITVEKAIVAAVAGYSYVRCTRQADLSARDRSSQSPASRYRYADNRSRAGYCGVTKFANGLQLVGYAKSAFPPSRSKRRNYRTYPNFNVGNETMTRTPNMATVSGIPPSSVKTSKSESGSVRTELGRKLREIRRRIVAGGQPLLNLNALDREVGERRGESQAEA